MKFVWIFLIIVAFEAIAAEDTLGFLIKTRNVPRVSNFEVFDDREFKITTK